MGPVADGEGQTGDGLRRQFGRAVVGTEADRTQRGVTAQRAEHLGVDAVEAGTQTDERTQGIALIAHVQD
ncbi:MAG: hypothetical protein ACK520_05060, partial [Inhella sp.]